MRFSKKTAVLALMLASLTAIPLSINAQGKGKGNPNNCPHAVQGPERPAEGQCRMIGLIPDLSPEQQVKVEELRLKHLETTVELKAKLREKEAHLETLAVAQKPDMNAINATIDEIAGIKSGLRKNQMAFRMDVRALLTPEQRVVFDQRASMMKGKGPRGQHPGCGQGPGGMHNRHGMPR